MLICGRIKPFLRIGCVDDDELDEEEEDEDEEEDDDDELFILFVSKYLCLFVFE